MEFQNPNPRIKSQIRMPLWEGPSPMLCRPAKVGAFFCGSGQRTAVNLAGSLVIWSIIIDSDF
jgi:hypothetical protein